MCHTNRIIQKAKSCGDCRDRNGKNNSFYGKHHTQETIKHLSKINSENSWIKNIDPSLLPYTKNYKITYTDGSSKKVAGLKAIAEEFKVSIENVHSTIKRIAEGKIPKKGVFAGIIIGEMAV
jgi:hypothetical protein